MRKFDDAAAHFEDALASAGRPATGPSSPGPAATTPTRSTSATMRATTRKRSLCWTSRWQSPASSACAPSWSESCRGASISKRRHCQPIEYNGRSTAYSTKRSQWELAPLATTDSPCRIKDRTFACSFQLPERQAEPKPPKLYPNPMALAQAWNDQIQSGKAKSRADLARQLGVSRAHVTQVLRILKVAPNVKDLVLALGDPVEGRIVGVHGLRSMARLPTEEQEGRIRGTIEQRRS